MKTNSLITKITCSIIFLGSFLTTNAQINKARPVVGVLGIDTKGFTIEPAQMGNITRTELSRLGIFQVMDPYDAEYLMSEKGRTTEGCFGKICLVEVGKIIKADKMLSGSVEVYGESIIVTFRLIDVGTESIEKTHIMEFLNVRQQVQLMIQLTLQAMFDQPTDQVLLNKLTQKLDYESTLNIPTERHLNLSGPRLGVMLMTGELADIFEAKKSEGGFDAYRVMFQFGYQFEVKYLNQGDFQALFEFVPTITGLDQGKFIPSLTFLNGMRSNRTGLEFAFGPIIYGTKKAKGYYVDDTQWVLEGDISSVDSGLSRSELTTRVDSRGSATIDTRFVFAVGKTFKSGNLNIPLNVYFIPNKSGHRIGLSVGYNSRATPK